MLFRQLEKINCNVSALGFGAMRLPEKNGLIDENEATRMIRYAVDHGVNYIDTAYVYHDGQSEPWLGRALEDGYRQRVYIATKQPTWLVEQRDDGDRFLNEQLKRLNTDHIDFYLLHGLFSSRWRHILDLDILNWAEKALADGRIGYLGFSFHGTYACFEEIIAYYPWDFCQIQYNYMNEHFQAGSRGLAVAAAKGIPVVIMEPLLGGMLANPQGAVKDLWQKAAMDPVDVALRWLWSKPEVSVVLSGMSTMEQLQHNIAIASSARAASLNSDEREIIETVKQAYARLSPVPCTQCEYCLPCPQGVNIPRNFELYNQAVIYGNPFLGKSHYNWHTAESERAASCIGCGVCEEKCPQGIAISKLLPDVHEALLFREGEV